MSSWCNDWDCVAFFGGWPVCQESIKNVQKGTIQKLIDEHAPLDQFPLQYQIGYEAGYNRGYEHGWEDGLEEELDD